MKKALVLVTGATLACSQLAYAAPDNSVSFAHHDWELACDNTRTCRAVGYQADDNLDHALALLLTRKAGAKQAVTAELMLGDIVDDANKANILSVDMLVNGKNLGKVLLNKGDLSGTLSGAQVAALLATVKQKAIIQFVAKQHTWQLSDAGMAATLLKMDEAQGRINTSGALVKKGNVNEARVLPALPKPVIYAVKPLDAKISLSAQALKQLQTSLLTTLNKDDDDCPMLSEPTDEYTQPTEVVRLNAQKLLVSAQCWRGAYNTGIGYWVINSNAPYNPVLVTTSASDYGNGVISAAQKGRGVGDCWSADSWVWNGRQFVQSESLTTGMCKGVAAGGAWSLPTVVSEVRQAK